jgi:hypothetical protein
LPCGNSLVASKPLASKNVCAIFIFFKQGKDLIFSLVDQFISGKFAENKNIGHPRQPSWNTTA